MPTHLVNLDCLIQREDFESSSQGSIIGNEPLFKVEELHRKKLYFSVLRKPDFQRMTANWTPGMVMEFIRSFLDGDLIPSIIIWHSKTTGKIFIVDGAHRLSALIAWVNDDYGDGTISREAWNYKIPKAQAELHRKTKALVEEHIGSFDELYKVGIEGDAADPLKLKRGRAIATRQPHIQRVEGDALIAEKSFFTINSNPATIDETELGVIRARAKPNVIATRALIAGGKGHQYWGKFHDRAKQIEDTSAKAYDLLFGDIVEIGAQNPDLPRAGQPYSDQAFKMVLDLVNLVNGITPAMWQLPPTKNAKVARIPDDGDGAETLTCLGSAYDVARLVTGNDTGSLGMDHAVYSYSATGFQPAAYLAALCFAKELSDQSRLLQFTRVRADFEEFLVRHKRFINVLGHSKGSRTRSLESLLLLHRTILRCLLDGADSDTAIRKELERGIKDIRKEIEEIENPSSGAKFSKKVVQAKLAETVLAMRERCPICHARLPPSARSKDHKVKVADAGVGSLENLQFTHAYCNNSRDALGEITPRLLI